jgi:hypothetical protein
MQGMSLRARIAERVGQEERRVPEGRLKYQKFANGSAALAEYVS